MSRTTGDDRVSAFDSVFSPTGFDLLIRLSEDAVGKAVGNAGPRGVAVTGYDLDADGILVALAGVPEPLRLTGLVAEERGEIDHIIATGGQITITVTDASGGFLAAAST